MEPTNWYPLLLDSVHDYAFILLNSQNQITHWSRGAELILGWPRQEILGLTGEVFFTPEDRATGQVDKEIQKSREEGRAEDERWHLRKDGSRFWASGVLTALRNDHGELLGFAKILRDLTERRLASEALSHSEEQLRLFQENVCDYALFQVNTAGLVSSWNPGAQRLFGYASCEILHRPVATLYTPEDQAKEYPQQQLDSALRNSRVEDERWLVGKDGKRFWGRWVTHLIRDQAGAVRGFATVLQDETKRKLEQERRVNTAAEEREVLISRANLTTTELNWTKDELRALAARLMTAQDEERRRLARELHDDLAQGLALLEIRLQSAREHSSTWPPPLLDTIDRVSLECRALSERVRTLSHALHPSILADLGLESALRNLVEDSESAHSLAIQVHVSIMPNELSIDVSTALYRVAQEALRNIAKHAPDALVTVRLWQEGDDLCLAISDTGPGFNPDSLALGAGLGLVSMQERMRLVDGTLHLRSTPASGTSVAARVRWQRALQLNNH